jgi:hypothetical protein
MLIFGKKRGSYVLMSQPEAYVEGSSPKIQSSADEKFIADSVDIVEGAQKKGLVLRIIGALAVRLHSKEATDLHLRLGRLGGSKQFTDLDLIGYGKQIGKVANFMEKDRKFKIDNYFLMRMGGQKRLKYYHPANLYAVDIFFDRLSFSHEIYFGEKPDKGRLELDFPTITLTDLVLEKTQINRINEKDIKDLIVLFKVHGISETDAPEKINGKYIAKTLSEDWGFYYDVRNNLEKVKSFGTKYVEEGKITQQEMGIVQDRVDGLIKMIEEEPKSQRWKVREKIGTSKPWYNEVDDLRTMNF